MCRNNYKDRKQVVPKERYKPKAMNAQIREGKFLAQEIQEGFMKEAPKPAGPWMMMRISRGNSRIRVFETVSSPEKVRRWEDEGFLWGGVWERKIERRFGGSYRWPQMPKCGQQEATKDFWVGQWHRRICALELYTRHSFLGKEGGRICETLLLLPRFPVEDTVITLFFRVLLSPHTSTTLAFLPTM